MERRHFDDLNDAVIFAGLWKAVSQLGVCFAP
jgi:hypothetical protein